MERDLWNIKRTIKTEINHYRKKGENLGTYMAMALTFNTVAKGELAFQTFLQGLEFLQEDIPDLGWSRAGLKGIGHKGGTWHQAYHTKLKAVTMKK